MEDIWDVVWDKLGKHICLVPNCHKMVSRAPLCELHHNRLKKHGNPFLTQKPGKPPKGNEERFWAKVNKTDTCWLWLAKPTKWGYGQFYVYPTGNQPAHRFAYELLKGSIPKGMCLHHICNNPLCVNPQHMRVMPQRIHTLHTPNNIFTIKSKQTHCIHGHPFTPENTYINPDGRRVCHQCKLERWRAKQGSSWVPSRPLISYANRGEAEAPPLQGG